MILIVGISGTCESRGQVHVRWHTSARMVLTILYTADVKSLYCCSLDLFFKLSNTENYQYVTRLTLLASSIFALVYPTAYAYSIIHENTTNISLIMKCGASVGCHTLRAGVIILIKYVFLLTSFNVCMNISSIYNINKHSILTSNRIVVTLVATKTDNPNVYMRIFSPLRSEKNIQKSISCLILIFSISVCKRYTYFYFFYKIIAFNNYLHDCA